MLHQIVDLDSFHLPCSEQKVNKERTPLCEIEIKSESDLSETNPNPALAVKLFVHVVWHFNHIRQFLSFLQSFKANT